MSRTKNKKEYKEIKQESLIWVVLVVIYTIILLGILLIGIFGLCSVESEEAKPFIFKKMIESGLDGLVVGIIVFAIGNAFSKLSENTKRIDELNN